MKLLMGSTARCSCYSFRVVCMQHILSKRNNINRWTTGVKIPSSFSFCFRWRCDVRWETVDKTFIGPVREGWSDRTSSVQYIRDDQSLLRIGSDPDPGPWWEEPSSHNQCLEPLRKPNVPFVRTTTARGSSFALRIFLNNCFIVYLDHCKIMSATIEQHINRNNIHCNALPSWLNAWERKRRITVFPRYGMRR